MAIFLVFFLLLMLGYTWLITTYNKAWDKLEEVDFRGPDNNLSHTSITLIIPVRNEEKQIARLVEDLYSLEYPADLLEIFVVNDHSTDDTWQLLSSLAAGKFKINAINLPDTGSGKKAAIAFAVGKAKGNMIVTTDADCVHHPLWLITLSNFFRHTGAKFIAAPVKMLPRRGLFSVFQVLDFLALQGITGAAVSGRLHCMCNGANLAYDREAFMQVGGFEEIDHIPSGDDMLLMYKVFQAYPDKVFYLKSKGAIVATPAEPTLAGFLHQRIRWSSKAVHYNDKRIFYTLLLTYAVNIFFAGFAVAVFFYPKYLWLLILLLMMKTVIELPFVYSVASFFNQKKLLILFPFLQPMHIVYTTIAGWFGRFGSYRWKSRTVKNVGRTKLLKQ